MRIGCLQFAPQVGDVDNNLNRADSVLAKASGEDLDLLVLPELAFSGYNFKSLQDIMPFLEPSGSGITSLWARTVALKYNCIVAVGYPEKVDVSPKWPTGPEYYNSVILVNGDGETIANYRKSFLYYTDESWALEGKGFFNGWIPGLGNTSIGICMDINPYKFEAPWHAYEFAFHILEMKANLVIVSMAWMTREERRRFSRMPNEPDMETLTYWVTRLEPLIRAENEGEIIVIFCNRTGIEDEATYAGTSAVIGIDDGEVKVYGLLGRGEKDLLVVDTNDAPYAKLVYRPDGDDADTAEDEIKKSAPSGAESSTAAAKTPDTSDKESEANSEKANKKSEDAPSSSTEAKRSASASGSLRNASAELQTPAQKRERSRGRSRERKADLLPPPPPPPPPPPYFHDDDNPISSNEAQKKRPAVPISIPEPSKPNSKANSAVTPSSANFNLPTPSAPSPTPMAVRPRIVIPQSPPAKPQQVFPDNPMSAISQRSEKSIQSIKSDESEASTQTVRSNPRPPEDSTPYPHSGAPLSGYPANSLQQQKKIYGGYVNIQHENFTPTTPFEDMSPLSPRWFWRPPDSAIRTPISAGGWFTGTPVGRHPEPFPWPEIRAKSRSRSRASNRTYNRRNVESKTPDATGSASARPGSAMSWRTDGEPLPQRPSSPKSRNASRSRTNERSDSALGQLNFAVATQHLEDVSQRAHSANQARDNGTSIKSNPLPEKQMFPRPPSSNHVHQPSSSESAIASRSTIPIVASPSIMEKDGHGKLIIPTPVALDYYRPVSRSAYHQRSNSFSTSNEYYSLSPGVPDDGITTPIERGRQPAPKDHEAELDASIPSKDRASSTDSTRNDVLHRRVRRSKEGKDSERNQSQGQRSRRGRHSAEDKGLEFERVEAILCPSCPVHGRGSNSSSAAGTAPSSRNSRTHRHHHKRSNSHGEGQSYGSIDAALISILPRSAPAALTSNCDSTNLSDYHETKSAGRVEGRREAVSPTARPTTAPSYFDSPTPKPMPLILTENGYEIAEETLNERPSGPKMKQEKSMVATAVPANAVA